MSAGRAGLRRDTVPAAFDAAAASYDRLVGINPGYHRHLRLSARRMGLPAGRARPRLLDAGCGTGASTAALLSALPNADITAVDASAAMLARACAKRWPSPVRFVHSDVARLHDAGVHGPFDGIFAAYLLRNLADPDAALTLLLSLLRPGGTLALHEYSVRDSMCARAVWHVVCLGVIVPAGRLVNGDGTLYRHLWRSVAAFDGVTELRRRLWLAGFTGVRDRTVPGWQRGVVHTVLATAPTGEEDHG